MTTTHTGEVKIETAQEEVEAVAPEEASGGSSPADNGQAGSKSKGRRGGEYGKGFIYLGLGDCDKALREIDAAAKTMSVDQFALALGHKAPKSRFLNKIDALKAYGLIEPDTSASVTLSQLGDDMLYGAAKAKARTTAFLNYSPFKKLYVDFPKARDNARTDIVNFIKAKLGIRNEIDRFLRLFLESAEFAGLLDGAADPNATVVRLRANPTSNEPAADAGISLPVGEAYAVIPADEVDDQLEAAGLSEFKQRSEVRERTTGQYSLAVGEGDKITIEITRPVQIIVRPENLVADLPRILDALHQKGLRT